MKTKTRSLLVVAYIVFATLFASTAVPHAQAQGTTISTCWAITPESGVPGASTALSNIVQEMLGGNFSFAISGTSLVLSNIMSSSDTLTGNDLRLCAVIQSPTPFTLNQVMRSLGYPGSSTNFITVGSFSPLLIGISSSGGSNTVMSGDATKTAVNFMAGFFGGTTVRVPSLTPANIALAEDQFRAIHGDLIPYTGLLSLYGASAVSSINLTPDPVPEPSTWALCISGLALLIFLRRGRRQSPTQEWKQFQKSLCQSQDTT